MYVYSGVANVFKQQKNEMIVQNTPRIMITEIIGTP